MAEQLDHAYHPSFISLLIGAGWCTKGYQPTVEPVSRHKKHQASYPCRECLPDLYAWYSKTNSRHGEAIGARIYRWPIFMEWGSADLDGYVSRWKHHKRRTQFLPGLIFPRFPATKVQSSQQSRSNGPTPELFKVKEPSSLGLTTTRATQEQQGGPGDSATFASNTASVQHVPYKGSSPRPRRPDADKRSANTFERMEHDLLGVGSHAFDKGNIQHGPHARYSDPLGCPHHRRINQESLVSRGSSQGLSPMDRFRAEGLSERNAILPRPDILDRPLHKCHQCNKMIQGRNGVSEDNRGA
ncbi:hypothetical protein JMJ35_008934 [Cladonia borealis]|uniref:Uncharacterized protein n=1 Tax=Cladonia borealis TaxID=184061 RepID=A0AA39QVV1_9LECA|nr:hypothetical protein JMJ35_008934 [Cladonia borealis]